MGMVNSFAEVIDVLGGVSRFADAVGMKPNTAKMARARNSISPLWWPKVVNAAAKSGRPDVNLERLVELAAKRRAA